VNVADLQQHFRNVVAFVEVAKPAEKVLNELRAVVEAFGPFAGYSLADFGAFLVKAEEYNRTGVLPVVPEKKTKAAAKPRVPKAPVPSASETIDKMFAFYETVIHSSLTDAEIDAQTLPIEKLPKAALETLVAKMHLSPTMKKLKVGEMRTKIRSEFRERKFRYERSDY